MKRLGAYSPRPHGVDPRLLIELVVPALREGRAEAVAETVLARWQPEQLCPLLEHDEVDVRRVAAITLGLVGDAAVTDCLLKALHDPDLQVNRMAEHGLWSIWFRSCHPRAAEPFRLGVGMVAQDHYERALGYFRRAQEIDGGFAEAFNQCAVAHFFLQEWTESLEDCLETLERVPRHFGALAGMGHCYTQLDELDRAADCYRHALLINPRMPAIRTAIEGIDSTKKKPLRDG
jgi:tetratricopeptide (TPR) repeat protein